MIVYVSERDPTFTWAGLAPTHPILQDDQLLRMKATELWAKASKITDDILESNLSTNNDERWQIVRSIQNRAIEYEDASDGKLSQETVEKLMREINDG